MSETNPDQRMSSLLAHPVETARSEHENESLFQCSFDLSDVAFADAGYSGNLIIRKV
jgi:hypothetical protein